MNLLTLTLQNVKKYKIMAIESIFIKNIKITIKYNRK